MVGGREREGGKGEGEERKGSKEGEVPGPSSQPFSWSQTLPFSQRGSLLSPPLSTPPLSVFLLN